MDDIFSAISGPGYEQKYGDVFVPEKNAFEYAMEKMDENEELKRDFVEWFFRDWYWTGDD